MEEEDKKLNFVRNGVAKLPPGFRFEPTDEEIVFRYLKCKALGLPLPATVIPEINVCQYDPWELPGEEEQDKYFFCRKKMKMSRSNLKATSHSGYWKSTGEEDRLIKSSTTADNRLIGLRKTMVFYKGKSSAGDAPSSTGWTMHEYHLIFSCPSSAHSKSQSLKNSLSLSFLMMKEGWTICHILRNNPVSYKSVTLNKRARHIDSTGGFKFLKLDNGAKTPPPPPLPSSSSSSCSTLTEISSESSC